MTRRVSIALCLALALPGLARAQSPEARGSLGVGEHDAGRVAHAGVMIPTRVLYPTGGAGPYPLVGVIHGASRTGARHRVLAETFASRGFVVVLPDMPCGLGGCDHDANADQLVAMLEWAVTQSETPSSPLAGLVDGSRRALVGHSWGALASHMAAARDPSIDAVVLFDPNDDGTVGRDATATVMAPTAQLLASVPGACNSAWMEAAVGAALPTPNLELTVSGSAHCDPEDPGDFLCPIGCGSGDASTSVTFRRYAIAWVSCVLTGDAAMGPWLGGASMSGDESGGVIEGVEARGLDALPCRGAVGTDAGVPPGDDAGMSGNDGGVPPGDDAGSTAMDAGGSSGSDGGGAGADAAVRTDAGAGGTDGGCSCRSASGPRRSLGLVLSGIGIALATRKLRRR